ncbi:MAG: hypothetical protein EZS28_005995 [Streblomastix strix]|uniref:Uncharacterized protein n=1 Tax=Streblomastix strix TaxID=222440 RepID=A0A5J4WU40_9EUKA|nr:MAG: hypothetical protein EZS28_005995 [Streblomastix strix]
MSLDNELFFPPFPCLVEFVVFPPLGSQERFLVYESLPLFYSEFIQVGIVRGLAPGCQRCQSSLQFQFATTEVFVLVALLPTGVLPPFFSTIGSRIGFPWSCVEGAIRRLFDKILGLVEFVEAKPIENLETMNVIHIQSQSEYKIFK